MIYLLRDPSAGDYALFNEITKQYSWWCKSLEDCWASYNKGLEIPSSFTVKSIIESRNHRCNTDVQILEIYTVDSHPEHFI